MIKKISMDRELFFPPPPRNRRHIKSLLLTIALCAVFAVSCAPVTGDNDDDPGGIRITKFVIDGVEGLINQDEKTIEVILPPKTNLTALMPEIEFFGASIVPAIGETVDFSAVEPVEYTLFSKDSSATYYKIKVFAGNPDDNKIVSFELDGVTAISVSITEQGDASGAISVTVPYGTALSNLTAKISYNGDSINPLEGSARDFSQTPAYDVYSRQGNIRTYSVTVTAAPNTANNITSFVLDGATGVIDGTNITVTVPYGSTLAALTPVIGVSAGATVSPTGAQNFTVPVTYTVTAADGTTAKDYTVTAASALNSAKEITSFTIPGQISSVIDGQTITVTLPANMPKTSLTPEIVLSGGTVSPAIGTAKNFESPVAYTVTAADSSTKTYTVSVTTANAVDVSLVLVTANGENWKIDTTKLTLIFNADMGTTALKPEHIILTPATGTITKGNLTRSDSGVYELGVSGIPGNGVSVSVVIRPNSVYGYNVSGTRTATVYTVPETVTWSALEQSGGTDKIQDTTALKFTFDKTVTGLTPADITLGVGATGTALSVNGTVYTLTVTGITTNGGSVTATPDKTGFTFAPTSRSVTVYKKLSADASLKSLTVDGSSLSPAFSSSAYTYDVTVYTDTIRVTAMANDANAKLMYVENNAAVSSGTVFTTKTLSEGANTVTVKVTAENGTDTKSYKLNVTYVKPFVTVPGGSFEMGSETNNDEKPVHRVTLSAFSIAKYEVTQKEWKELMGTDPSNWKGDNLPVEQVSWFDAVEYCNKLSLKEGLTPAYTVNGTNVTWNKSANGYRLPTEAEWEYAARGGNVSQNYEYAGSNTVSDVAWYTVNSGNETHEVGTKRPNELGLYDMSGNVWEWCWDWKGGYSSGAQTNPEGASSGSDRVERGGAWHNLAAYVRSAYRSYASPSYRNLNLGFRLVRP